MSSQFSFAQDRIRIGFFLNPYAGLGGPQALKGSDALAANPSSIELRSQCRSAKRAMQFFKALHLPNKIEFVFDEGVMGLASLQLAANAEGNILADLTQQIIHGQFPFQTNAEHSRQLCHNLLAEKIDMLLFVGGDGTARDVCRAVGDEFPVLGIPAGVKMHSGVFAISPSAAASVVDALATGELVTVGTEEVRDIDEKAFQQGVVRSCHFGEMLVPQELRFIQHVKQGGIELDELVLLDIAQEIQERMDQTDEKSLYIFAPGSTTNFVLEYLGGKSTLLGVDLFDGQKVVANDVDARELERMTGTHNGKIILVLTAIGGQGHIIGRGNQQISAAMLHRIGRDNLWVIATKNKLQALASRPLIIDSGDDELDQEWQGLISVITGYRDTVLYRVGGH